MKIRVWIDSNANHQSCNEHLIDVEDLGVSEQEWIDFTEDQKHEAVRDYIFDCMGAEYGYLEHGKDTEQ